MKNYVKLTEYAAYNLINLINHDDKKLSMLKKELSDSIDSLHMSKAHLEQIEKSHHPWFRIPFLGYHDQNQKNTKKIRENISILELNIKYKEQSINALSMSLLQIAKQGISIIHKGLQNCPTGRSINGVFLKDLIWQGRNQSIHYEEGNYSNAVMKTFNQLKDQYGNKYDLTTTNSSLAKEIIGLLNWADYSKYESDILSLS